MPDDVYSLARQYRLALRRRDAEAAARIIKAYGLAYLRIQKQLAQLTATIATARAAGEPIDQVWLLREDRLRSLELQVLTEITRFSRFAEKLITIEQADAARVGVSQAQTMIGLATSGISATATFNRVPTGAVEAAVGFLQQGSPFRALLNVLGATAAQKVGEELVAGIALGDGPQEIARRIREALGGNLTRALTIARTEVFRAHRIAQQEAYKLNQQNLRGWVWISARDRRTCAMCWAMHGTVHPIDEPFGSHPNCRCTTAPITLHHPGLESGEEAFADLPVEDQLHVLGPGKFKLYRAGALQLWMLVGQKTDGRWGLVRWELGLKDVAGLKNKSRAFDRVSPR